MPKGTNGPKENKVESHPLDVPPELKREPGDEKSSTPVNPKPVVEAKKSKYGALEKPSSMTDEEFEAKKAELAPTSNTKTGKFTGKKKAKNPDDGEAAEARAAETSLKRLKAAKSGNTFRLKDWASENGIKERDARHVARTHAKILEPMWHEGLKHTFKNSDKDKVAKIIRDGQAGQTKKKVKISKAKKK